MYNPFKKNEVSGENKVFKCYWCGFEFKNFIKTSNGDKRSKVSNQTRCPHCKGFLSNDSGEL